MEFDENICMSIYLIKHKKFECALTHIHLAMIQNDISPKPHNLLGLLCEIKGDLDSALKHYTAAYYLDATFKPAYKNLERITSFNYIFNFNNLYYDDLSEENNFKYSYTIQYEGNIGHLTKNIF